MAAPLGFKTFTTGEVLTAGDTNGYLMQGIWVFASAAARDAAVTSPQEGNFAFLKDTNVTTYYTGSAWANLDTTGMTNPMTTTGDIIYSSPGSTPVRLGIGSTGNVLTVAAGVPSWSAPASGGGMTLISETVASAISSLSLSSIPGTYKQLLLIYSGIRHSSNSNSFGIRFNNNSGSVYPNAGFTASGSPGTVSITGNTPDNLGSGSPTAMFAFGKGTSNANLSTDVAGSILIDNYASSTKAKSVVVQFQYYDDSNGTYLTKNSMSVFNDTTAITSIDVVQIAGAGTFSNTTNTTIRLYGVS